MTFTKGGFEFSNIMTKFFILYLVDAAQEATVVSQAGFYNGSNCSQIFRVAGAVLTGSSGSSLKCGGKFVSVHSFQHFDLACVGVQVDMCSNVACPNQTSVPSVRTTIWSVYNGLYRLQECPAGYILVRDERFPANDECIQCPPGKYSESPATFVQQPGLKRLVAVSATNATILCNDCPGV